MKRLIIMALTAMTLGVNAQQKMYLTIGGVTKSVTLVNNSATQELVLRLQSAPITVTLNSSGGFEIWGALGFSLTTSNEQVNAQPGDIMLYNGSNLCMFYGTNSWSYTRLGHIDGLSESELRTFLHAGESNISVMLSINNGTTAIHGISTVKRVSDEFIGLNGVGAKNPIRGIYIKDGRKIVK
ncbi:MAG: hypothetical protein IKX22_05720 [Prevotella sp.]|nr:hypothetical protein [Prevotella sp.]